MLIVWCKAECNRLWWSQSQSAHSSSNGFSFLGWKKRCKMRSARKPNTMPEATLMSSIGKMYRICSGCENRIGRASSLVERNTASSVPTVMMRPA